MTKQTSWSSLIFGSAPVEFSVATAIFRATGILARLEVLMRAAETSLATMAVVAVAVWSPACFSAQTHRRRIQLRMLSLPHFMSALQTLVLALTLIIRELGFLQMETSRPSTLPLSRHPFPRVTGRVTTDRSRATCATNT